MLFAGRVVPDKAPDAFISGFAAASPHICPAGSRRSSAPTASATNSPETPFFKTMQASAEGAGVRMLGFREHPDVLTAMSRAAVVVMPSRWEEPFGLVALEAMASGAALICSPRGALREVAGDAALFIDPDSVPSVASAIRLLAQQRGPAGRPGGSRAQARDAVRPGHCDGTAGRPARASILAVRLIASAAADYVHGVDGRQRGCCPLPRTMTGNRRYG